uniref:Selenoprotein W n=1 Tax=Podarcis muralis TaxID=64176 RepID=A0A670JNZ3_PODMU
PGTGKPCGFESAYLELENAVKEEFPDVEIESRLGGTGAFEIEINGQLIFSNPSHPLQVAFLHPNPSSGSFS